MSEIVQRPLETEEKAKLAAETAKVEAEAEAARHVARSRRYEADELAMDLENKRRERALADAANTQHRFGFCDEVGYR